MYVNFIFLASTATFDNERDFDESDDPQEHPAKASESCLVTHATEENEDLNPKLIIEIQNICKNPILDKRMY